MGVSCIILAGGRSSRLGKDKALLLLNKQPLITYVFNSMEKIFSEIVIVVKNERQKMEIKKILKNVKIVEDKNRICSPIAGIEEGIKHITNDYVFVVACDMPFVDEETVRELLSRINKGIDCVAYARNKNYYEPLCAVYKKQIFTGCDLKESLHSLIDKAENKSLVPVNENNLTFFNINTKKDLEFAKKIIAK